VPSERFTTQALQDKGWAEAEGFAFFAAMQTYIELFDARPSTDKHMALHAAHAVGEAYKAAKAVYDAELARIDKEYPQ
jgi:hypothetical protein